MLMNLLYDSIFTVDAKSGRKRCTLPGIYRLLQEDEVESFARIQSHQKQAWHCFLAQLGAVATEDRSMPETEAGWREALLSQASEEAWNLQTDNLDKPAFMQPPVPEDSIEDWDELHVTEYDVPVLSKNHALKKHRMHDPKPEHWAYMLVNVQTNDSGWGRGKYPTSRMNSGYGSRPFFTITPSLRPGEWILHDIKRMHAYRKEMAERLGYESEIPPLLWTFPWDGIEEEFCLTQMHPWYIDCPRRIRYKNGKWRQTGTDGTRVGGVTKGRTGDPWAPVDIDDNKVLNPQRRDFQYRRLQKILFGSNYRRPITFRDVPKGYIVCHALTPDQFEREFSLWRTVKFTTKESVSPFDEEEDGEDTIVAREAKTRVDEAGTAVSILTHALDWLLCDDIEEGPDGDSRNHRENVQPLKEEQEETLHSRIDQRFFDCLFQAPDYEKHERRAYWQDILVRAFRTQWKDAKTLCPSQNRWHRLAEAESIIDRRIPSFDHATSR
jgi:CRISPR system Cascade subunit CasA